MSHFILAQGAVGEPGTGSSDRIRVRTIVITTPQQVQILGARGFTRASADAGTNLSNRCSKAISRLQRLAQPPCANMKCDTYPQAIRP